MKITVTFELEFENEIPEDKKMKIIHKIDECIATLEPAEIFTKRTVFTSFPPQMKSPWKTVADEMNKIKSLKL